MKTPRILRATGGALLSTALLLAFAPVSHADLFYTVTLTFNSAFVADANANGPFALEVQLNPGSGNGTVVNTATLSNFALSGGTFTGSAFASIGGVTQTPAGTLTGSSSVTLTNAGSGSDFGENFNLTAAGTLSFLVDQTTNSEVANVGTTPSPDQFLVFLDNPTNASFFVSTGDVTNSSVLTSVINSGETLAPGNGISKFDSTGSDAGVTTATAVPEPASMGMLLCGAVGLIARRRRSATRLA